jgi:hypothetical protein
VEHTGRPESKVVLLHADLQNQAARDSNAMLTHRELAEPLKVAEVMLPTALAVACLVHRMHKIHKPRAKGVKQRNPWVKGIASTRELQAHVASLCGALLAVTIATAAIQSHAWYPLLHSALALMAADRRCALALIVQSMLILMPVALLPVALIVQSMLILMPVAICLWHSCL